MKPWTNRSPGFSSQSALSEPGDYRALFEGALTLAVTKRLALRMSLELRYDSQPPAGVDRAWDLDFANGLTFSF